MFSYRLRTAVQPGVKSALFNQKAVFSAAAPVSQGAQFLHTPTTTATSCDDVFASPLSSAKSSTTTMNVKYYGSDHKVEKKLFNPAVNAASFRQVSSLRTCFAFGLPYTNIFYYCNNNNNIFNTINYFMSFCVKSLPSHLIQKSKSFWRHTISTCTQNNNI